MKNRALAQKSRLVFRGGKKIGKDFLTNVSAFKHDGIY